MTVPYIPLLLAFAGAVLYFRLGEIEYRNGMLPAMLSVAASIITFLVLNGGYLTFLIGQAAVYGVLLLWNLKNPPKHL